MFLVMTSSSLQSFKDHIEMNIKRLRWALTIAEIIIILIDAGFVVFRVVDTDKAIAENAEKYFILVLFALTLLCYIYVNIKLIMRLKTYYPNYYIKEKKKVRTRHVTAI